MKKFLVSLILINIVVFAKDIVETNQDSPEIINFKKDNIKKSSLDIKKDKEINKRKNKKNDLIVNIKSSREEKIKKREELEKEKSSKKESSNVKKIDLSTEVKDENKKEESIEPKKLTVKDILIDIFSDLDFLDTKISFTLLNELGKPVLSVNPDLSLNQASVSKVIITLATIKYLGLNYRFKTEFYIDGEIDEKGVLDGDLIVKGYGDPNLLISDIYKIVDFFKLSGLKKINGNLIIDLSYFDKVHSIYSLQKEDDSRSYAADNSALPLDYNSFKFSVTGKSTLEEKPLIKISYPASYFIKLKNRLVTSKRWSHYKFKTKDKRWKMTELEAKGRVKLDSPVRFYYRKVRNVDYYFGKIFYKILRKNGIRVTKRLRVKYDDQLKDRKEATLYYAHHTKYLFDTLILMNRYSNNFIAEQLLKIIGAETSTTESKQGSWSLGIKAIKKMLREDVKIDDSYKYETASGLNEANFFSSFQIARILYYAKTNFDYKWYLLSTLPKIGVSGTMRRYCLNEDCKGVVLAKTGTLRTTIALAGFLKGKKKIYTFSLAVNFKKSRKKRNKVLRKSKQLITNIIDIEEL